MSNKKSKPTVTFEVPSKAPDGNILLIKILLQMKIDSIKLQTRVRHHEDSRTKSIPIQLFTQVTVYVGYDLGKNNEDKCIHDKNTFLQRPTHIYHVPT